MTGKVLVYTAICGGYDSLKPQVHQTVNCDWVCFTDGHLQGQLGWQISSMSGGDGMTARMRSRWPKIQNHILFPGGWNDMGNNLGTEHYDYTVWIDGSMQITEPAFIESVIESIGPSGWSMFCHPWRGCTYAEVECAADMVKYRNQSMREQAAEYRRIGFPENQGLYACGVIARKSSALHLAAVGDLWWRECLNWSELDQVALPVVLWRLGVNVDEIPRQLWGGLSLQVSHRAWEYDIQIPEKAKHDE